MTRRAFAAMGTRWWIATDAAGALPDVVALVHAAERALSRFQERSALSGLNQTRKTQDPVVVEVLRAAEAARVWTGGAFDARLGTQIRALGYDRDLAVVRRPVARVAGPSCLEVHFEGTGARLEGPGEIDLGGLGKGWTVDLVAKTLVERGARRAVIDAGGDIRVIGGPHALGVPDGGFIELTNAALATSSTRGRRWTDRAGRPHHHLINPATGESTTGALATVTVTCASATRAEIVAKALIVQPSLAERIEDWGARALVLDGGGQAWCTPGWAA